LLLVQNVGRKQQQLQQKVGVNERKL